MGLIRDVGGGPVALDTSVFIYFVEQHKKFLPVVRPLFASIAAGKLEAVTSELTLLESLVAPYRASNAAMASRYEELLTHGDHVHLIPISRRVLHRAAQLRGTTGVLKTPDAIQLASGLEAGCRTFVTNDRSLPRIRDLAILQISDYVGPASDVHEGRGSARKPRTVARGRRT